MALIPLWESNRAQISLIGRNIITDTYLCFVKEPKSPCLRVDNLLECLYKTQGCNQKCHLVFPLIANKVPKLICQCVFSYQVKIYI